MIIEDNGLRTLAENGAVDPYDPEMIQPASIDLKLGSSFRFSQTHTVDHIDLAMVPPADEISELLEIKRYDPALGLGPGPNDWARFIIKPGEFVLGSTLEYLRIPEDICMVIDGKSSIGRLGLAVHVTAGFFDCGFRGIGTLEMVNLSSVPIVLRPGLPICQSRWMRMENVPSKVYDGRYQGDTSVSGSRYGQGRERA